MSVWLSLCYFNSVDIFFFSDNVYTHASHKLNSLYCFDMQCRIKQIIYMSDYHSLSRNL